MTRSLGDIVIVVFVEITVRPVAVSLAFVVFSWITGTFIILVASWAALVVFAADIAGVVVGVFVIFLEKIKNIPELDFFAPIHTEVVIEGVAS